MPRLTPVDIALLVSAALTALVAPLLASRRESGRHWGPALGVGAAYLLFQSWLARPAFPPTDVPDRVPWLGLVAIVLGLLESIRPGPGWTRWENRLIVTALTLWAVFGPVVANSDDPRSELTRVAASGLLMLIGWASLEGLADRSGARALGPTLAVVAGGTAAVLLATGSATLAGLAGGLAVALGLVWVASWFAPRVSLARGTIPVVITLLAALLLIGQVYGSTPPACAVLVAVATWAAWLGRIGASRRLGSWGPGVVGSVSALVPIGAALAVAFRMSSGDGES